MEHLISFVPGVEIVTSQQQNIKVISWAQNSSISGSDGSSVRVGVGQQLVSQDDDAQSGQNHQNRARAPLGDPHMVTLGKEMTDLLKDHKACVIPLSQLIQSFHKKYGRNPFKVTYIICK